MKVMNAKKVMKVTIMLTIMSALCIGIATTTSAQVIYAPLSYGTATITPGGGENQIGYKSSQLYVLDMQTCMQVRNTENPNCGFEKVLFARDAEDFHFYLKVKDSEVTARDKVIFGWSSTGRSSTNPCRYEICLGGIRRINMSGETLPSVSSVVSTIVAGGRIIEGKLPFSEINLPSAGQRVAIFMAQIDFNSDQIGKNLVSNCPRGESALEDCSAWDLVKVEMAQPTSIEISPMQLSQFASLTENTTIKVAADRRISRKGDSEFYIPNIIGLDGIRVNLTTNTVVIGVIEDGAMVTSVTGKVKKFGKCKILEATCVQLVGGNPNEKPPYLNSRNLSVGPNNTGVLIKTTGKVTQLIAGGFILSDGGKPISVLPRTQTSVAVGEMVIVTGISWLDATNGGLELRLAEVTSVGGVE